MSITALKITTPAVDFPVTLSEVKAHLRVTHSYEDVHIQALLAAASKWAEDFTGRILTTTTVEHRLDCFPKWGIALPGGKVSAVEKIDYTDTANVVQTLTGPTSPVPGTDYQEVLEDDERAILYPQREGEWPSTQYDLRNAVVVTYTVGWAASDVPENLRHAIKFKVADLYVVRDSAGKSAAESAAEALAFPYQIQAM